MIISALILIAAALIYLIDVRLGAAVEVYHCELGLESRLDSPAAIPAPEFWACEAPWLLAAASLPLASWSLPAAGLALTAALGHVSCCRSRARQHLSPVR